MKRDRIKAKLAELVPEPVLVERFQDGGRPDRLVLDFAFVNFAVGTVLVSCRVS